MTSHNTSQPGWMIDQVFGRQDWCTRWVHTLCQVNPEFLRHMSEQTSAYMHYLCLAYLGWHRQPRCVPSIAQQSSVLLSMSRKELLSGLYQPYPQGLVNILPKLGNRPLSRRDYLRLVSLLSVSGKREFLAHAEQIKPYHLQWLETFPAHLLHWQVLSSITRSADHAALKYIIKLVRNLEAGGRHKEVLVSIRRIRTFGALQSWASHFVLALDFPDPPWPGNDWIRPVTTVQQLKDVGLEFSNCVYDYRREVLLDYHYFYVSDRGPAVIGIKRDPVLGWLINEIKGPGNRKPAKADHEAIRLELIQAFGSDDMELASDMLWEDDMGGW